MAVKIEIEKDLFLESDERQFILRKYGKESVNDKGEITRSYTPLGHYGSVEGALRGYLKRATRQSNATSFKELVEDVKRVEAKIDSILEEVRGS